jgi:hypothetical protein
MVEPRQMVVGKLGANRKNNNDNGSLPQVAHVGNKKNNDDNGSLPQVAHVGNKKNNDDNGSLPQVALMQAIRKTIMIMAAYPRWLM